MYKLVAYALWPSLLPNAQEPYPMFPPLPNKGLKVLMKNPGTVL
jgi:hypothetical protein